MTHICFILGSIILILDLFLKNMFNRINRKRTVHLKHLLQELLSSYRHFRNFLEFHGGINQSSIIPKEVNIFDTNIEKQTNSIMNYSFDINYTHAHMLTVKEWLDHNLGRLRKGRKSDFVLLLGCLNGFISIFGLLKFGLRKCTICLFSGFA